MQSFLSLITLERLFGWLIYNLILLGILFALQLGALGLYGVDVVWSGPKVYAPAK